MEALRHLPRDPVEEVVFRCLESDDPDSELRDVAAQNPDMAQQARTLLERLDRQGLLAAVTDAPRGPQRLGPYEVVREIGLGGMGLVYEARDLHLDRRVAVKLVRPDLLPFDKSRQRFENEIAALSKLDHPGIVRVLSAGEQDGRRYYAMEFVDGASLQQVLARLGKKPIDQLHGRDLFEGRLERVDSASNERSALLASSWSHAALRIVRDVALALSHAHEQGVLHRDIKPGNIMLGRDGRARLLDFGLARSEDWQTMTRTGAAIGSLPYMAPEQIRGARIEVDERTDVYALGVVLFELLAMRSPFVDGDNPERTRDNILRARAPSLRSCNPDVPEQVFDVVVRAMAKVPSARYATAAQLAGDLDAVLAGRSLETGSAPVRLARRFPRLLLAVSGLLLMAALTFGMMWTNRLAEGRQLRAAAIGLRKEATSARSQAYRDRRERYLSRMNDIKVAIGQAYMWSANEMLEALPEEFRGWEWAHYSWRTQHHGRIWDLPESATGAWGIAASRGFVVAMYVGNRLMYGEPRSGMTRTTDKVGGKTIPSAKNRMISANGERLVVLPKTGADRLVLGDLVRNRTLEVPLHAEARMARLSDDGTLVWVGMVDGTGIVVDAADGTEQRRFAATGGIHTDVTFSPDSELVCVNSSNGVMALYEVDSGNQRWSVPSGYTIQLEFSPNGKRIHALRDQDDLRSYDTARGSEWLHWVGEDQHFLPAGTEPRLVQRFVCDPDGQHLWCSGQGSMLHCLHLNTKRWVHALPAAHVKHGEYDRVTMMAIDSHRNRLLASDRNRRIWQHDLHELKRTWLMPPYKKCTSDPTMNSNGDLFVAVWCGPPILRRAGEGPVAIESLPSARAALFLDESRVALGARDGGDVLIYDIDEGQVLATLSGSRSSVRCLELLPDGRLAVGHFSGNVRIWNLTSNECEATLPIHVDWVTDMQAVDEHRLACASLDGTVSLYDIRQQKHLKRWQLGGKGHALAVSPDKRWLCFGGEEAGVRAYDLHKDLLRRATLDRHISALEFTPDGRRLLIAQPSSGFITLMETSSWKPITTLHPHHGAGVVSLSFARDGQTLLTSGRLGLVRIWPIE